jgi:hypothetical protein
VSLSIQGFKDAFFTSEAIQKIIGPAEKKALGKMGGYVRRAAKNSLKYAEQPSSPGKPPTVHQYFARNKTNRKTGAVTSQQVSPLRELIFYAFDASTRSTVVGPALFTRSTRSTRSTKTVPGTLEKGGSVTTSRQIAITKGSKRKMGFIQKQVYLRKLRAGQIEKPPTQTAVDTKRYAPRPFMAPALNRSLPKFSRYFAKTS